MARLGKGLGYEELRKYEDQLYIYNRETKEMTRVAFASEVTALDERVTTLEDTQNILTAPNGTRYLLAVDNDGNLGTEIVT